MFKRNKTPFLHIMMDTPSFLFGRNTKQVPYNNQQFLIREKEGKKEREWQKHKPLAPSQKTNYMPKFVPIERHQRRREKNMKVSILRMQKTNGEPKQRKFCKTHLIA
jgi:hypothetical protein